MSYVKLQNENFDTFSLTLRPRYEFSSSSSGITGSVPLIERPSVINKDRISADDTRFTYNEERDREGRSLRNIASLSNRDTAQSNANRQTSIQNYLIFVKSLYEYQKNNIVKPIQRLTQSVDYTTSSMMKRVITNNLMTSYRSVYTDCNFSYKNYHSINFFTSSTVPSDSAIIYPNRIGGSGASANTEKRFNPQSEFSTDFFINPRYLADRGTAYHAGTILHISSSICLSLHTGSSKNQNDQIDGFRLAIGFGKSANVAPNLIDTSIANGSRSGEQKNIYVSSDNILKYNNWHHVSIRWGNLSTSRTGSFIVDGEKSNFIHNSANISLDGLTTDDVLILGNFCNIPVTQPTKKFFNSTVAADEGLITISGAGATDPTGFMFSNPLNAEIHDFKLFNRAISESEREKFSKVGSNNNNNTKNLVFYVPVLFTNQYTKTQNDFVTPVLKQSLNPVTPFNVNLAHAAQVFSPNLQNFLFDLSNFKKMGVGQRGKIVEYEAFPVAPRLYKLTSSVNTTPVDQFAIDHMLRDPAFVKRMYTLLPCDNGFFTPDYSILGDNNTTSYYPYKDDIGNSDKASISLQNTDINTPIETSLGMQTVDLKELKRATNGQIIRDKTFVRPDYYFVLGGDTLTQGLGNITTLLTFSGSIGERTAGFTNIRIADNSSNLVSMYTYSNLYYGNQIFPSSLQLSSTSLTGSGGKINITLKDNGAGGLYRDDALTPAATWATVGNIFYDQGIAIIKSPNLYYFGKDNFSTEFNGSQNIHTYTLDAICPAGEINSSSNPSYLSFPPTKQQNETADNFVYITGINIHDDNFNVIMRANLAQPVLKRPDDEILFRLKQDF